MALLAKGTWVVVADGEKALICENTGTPRAPRLRLHARMSQELLPDREIATDRPGRMPDPGPGQRSAMEETDHHRLAKERFAALVVERLNTLAARGKVERMVIAAPPQVLAVMRGGLDAALAGRVIAALPKTLTQHPLSRVGGMVADLIDPV